MPAGCFNSSELCNFAWLVVVRKIEGQCSIIFWPDCPWISNVDHVDIIVESHYEVGAAAGLAILHFLSRLEFSIHLVNVVLVGYLAAFRDRRVHIVRELRLHYNVVVQMLLEILSTLVSSVSIVNCEYLYLWPNWFADLWLLGKRLNYVQNDCNTIFILFSNEANVSVSCKRFHNAKLLVGCFRHLKVGQETAVPNLRSILRRRIEHWLLRFLLLQNNCWVFVAIWRRWCFFEGYMVHIGALRLINKFIGALFIHILVLVLPICWRHSLLALSSQRRRLWLDRVCLLLEHGVSRTHLRSCVLGICILWCLRPS